MVRLTEATPSSSGAAGGADNRAAQRRLLAREGAANLAQVDEGVGFVVGVGEAAGPIEHHELEYAQPAGELLGENDEVDGVVGFGGGDHNRTVAQAVPDCGDGGIGRIRSRAQARSRD